MQQGGKGQGRGQRAAARWSLRVETEGHVLRRRGRRLGLLVLPRRGGQRQRGSSVGVAAVRVGHVNQAIAVIIQAVVTHGFVHLGGAAQRDDGPAAVRAELAHDQATGAVLPHPTDVVVVAQLGIEEGQAGGIL